MEHLEMSLTSSSTSPCKQQHSSVVKLPPIPKIYCNGRDDSQPTEGSENVLSGEQYPSVKQSLVRCDSSTKSNSLPELCSTNNRQLLPPKRDFKDSARMERAEDDCTYSMSPLAAKVREDRLSVYCSPRVTRRARLTSSAWVRSRKDQFNWLNAFDAGHSGQQMENPETEDGVERVVDSPSAPETNFREKLLTNTERKSGALDIPVENANEMSRSYNDLLDSSNDINGGPVTVRIRRPSLLMTADEHLSKSCSHLAEFNDTRTSGIRDAKYPSQFSLMSPSSPLSSRISIYSDGTRSYEDIYDEAYCAAYGVPEKPSRLTLVREWLYYHTDSPKSVSPGTPP